MTSFPALPTNTVDHILSLSPYCKGLISTLYNNIFVISSFIHYKILGDFGRTILERKLQMIDGRRCLTWYTPSLCARHSLIQLKIVLRAYLTNARLTKIFPIQTLLVPAVKVNQQITYTCYGPAPSLTHFGPMSLMPIRKGFKKDHPHSYVPYSDLPLKLTPLMAKLM